MKTREGHVSNSSTSSFVLITTLANYESAIKKMDKFTTALISAAGKRIPMGREEMIVFHDLQSGMSSPFYRIDLPKFKIVKNIRGCDHKVPKGALYCQKCGSMASRKVKEYPYSFDEAWEKFKEEAMKDPSSCWFVRQSN